MLDEREILERIGSLEGDLRNLAYKTEADDNSIRQLLKFDEDHLSRLEHAVEKLTEQVERNRDDLMEVRDLGNLRQRLQDIQKELADYRETHHGQHDDEQEAFDQHMSDHSKSEGSRMALDRLSGRWVQPVVTGLLIGIVLFLLNLWAAASGGG